MFEIDEYWIRFMESPIAILEEYGVSMRTINSLEANYGIYIKHIQCVELDDLMKCSNIGPVHNARLRKGLRAFYQSVQEGKVNGI